jgi:hypothetical protein
LSKNSSPNHSNSFTKWRTNKDIKNAMSANIQKDDFEKVGNTGKNSVLVDESVASTFDNNSGYKAPQADFAETLRRSGKLDIDTILDTMGDLPEESNLRPMINQIVMSPNTIQVDQKNPSAITNISITNLKQEKKKEILRANQFEFFGIQPSIDSASPKMISPDNSV